ALQPARPDQRRRRAGRNPQRRHGQPQGHAERRRHQQRFRAAPEWPRHGPRDRPDRRRQHADRQEQDRQRDDHDHQLPERRADLLRPADPALAVPGQRDRRAVQSARGLRLPVHAERRRRLPAVRPAPPAEQRRVDEALKRGFMVWSTALDHNTQNCNLVVQAESMMMAKERIVEQYGPIRYTIGSGCSGGSIYQQQAANDYPGIFDGILPACSFPDSWSTAIEVVDCRLLVDYFDDPSKWAPGVAWPSNQQAAV